VRHQKSNKKWGPFFRTPPNYLPACQFLDKFLDGVDRPGRYRLEMARHVMTFDGETIDETVVAMCIRDLKPKEAGNGTAAT